MSLTTTMSDNKMFTYDEESQSDRLARKAKESPVFPIAIGTCSFVVAYGAYAFKNRGKMSTSVYLMHLRVAAQGAAVGALTIGLAYTMFNEYVLNKQPKD